MVGWRRVETGANSVAVARPVHRAVAWQAQKRDGVLVQQRSDARVTGQQDRASQRTGVGQSHMLMVPVTQEAGDLVLHQPLIGVQ